MQASENSDAYERSSTGSAEQQCTLTDLSNSAPTHPSLLRSCNNVYTVSHPTDLQVLPPCEVTVHNEYTQQVASSSIPVQVVSASPRTVSQYGSNGAVMANNYVNLVHGSTQSFPTKTVYSSGQNDSLSSTQSFPVTSSVVPRVNTIQQIKLKPSSDANSYPSSTTPSYPSSSQDTGNTSQGNLSTFQPISQNTINSVQSQAMPTTSVYPVAIYSANDISIQRSDLKAASPNISVIQQPGTKVYRCLQCNLSLGTSRALDSHMASHGQVLQLTSNADTSQVPYVMSNCLSAPLMTQYLTEIDSTPNNLHRPSLVTPEFSVQYQHEAVADSSENKSTSVPSRGRRGNYNSKRQTSRVITTVESSLPQAALIPTPMSTNAQTIMETSLKNVPNISATSTNVRTAAAPDSRQSAKNRAASNLKRTQVHETQSGNRFNAMAVPSSSASSTGLLTRGESYVVAATDLHQLQQSGGQLLVPAVSQQAPVSGSLSTCGSSSHCTDREKHFTVLKQEPRSGQQQIANYMTNENGTQIIVSSDLPGETQFISLTDNEKPVVKKEPNVSPELLNNNANKSGHLTRSKTGARPIATYSNNTVLIDAPVRVRGAATQQVIKWSDDPDDVTLSLPKPIRSNDSNMFARTPHPSRSTSRKVTNTILNRPYKCPSCSASFIDAEECEEHCRKHSSDGPFACEDCHFSFMYLSHFKSHKTRCLRRRAGLQANNSLHGISKASTSASLSDMPQSFPATTAATPRKDQSSKIIEFPVNDCKNNINKGSKRRSMQANCSINSFNEVSEVLDAISSATNTSHQFNDAQCATVSNMLYFSNDTNNQVKPQELSPDSGLRYELIGNTMGNNISPTTRVSVNKTPAQMTSSVKRKDSSRGALHNKRLKQCAQGEENFVEFNPTKPSFKRIKRSQPNKDRPFECDECDASFTADNDLQLHRQKHSDDGPFRCNGCQYVYLYRRLYDAHKRKCKKDRSKFDGPVGSPIVADKTDSIRNAGEGPSREVHESNTQLLPAHAHFVNTQQRLPQDSVYQQTAPPSQQQQQQIIYVESQASNNPQQIRLQQHSVPLAQPQLKNEPQGYVIASDRTPQTIQMSSQAAATPHDLAHQPNAGSGGAAQQFQILNAGGIQVLDASSIMEVRGHQLVAYGPDGTEVKYEIVNAVEENISQIVNILKRQQMSANTVSVSHQ